MHYCIQKIYHVYYTTQWNFIILSKVIHMTLASPNEKWMRVADIVRRFCHFLLWRREFCFDVVGNLNLRKWLQTAMHWQNRLFHTFESLNIHLFFQCKTMLFTNKKHAVTSSECAHSITWYKQKVRRNRWASKQVPRRYTFIIIPYRYIYIICA